MSTTTFENVPPPLQDENHYHSNDISQSPLPPFPSPKPTPTPISRVVSEFDLNQKHPYSPTSTTNGRPRHFQPHFSDPPIESSTNHAEEADEEEDEEDEGVRNTKLTVTGTDLVPPSLLSPAFTPPATPGTSTPASQRQPASIPVDSSEGVQGGAGARKPKLLEKLPTVNCVVGATIPTTTGTEIFLHLYQNDVDDKEHLAIVFGPHIRSRSLNAVRPGETEMDRMIRGAYVGRLYPGRTSSGIYPPSSSNNPSTTNATSTNLSTPPLVRIHSECYTGETAWSARCDCGEQLDEAARLMSLPPPPPSPRNPPTENINPSTSTGGVIIYLRQEGRGIGLLEKLKAYNLQDLGSDTVEANLLLRHPADARSYGLATAILVDLGLGGERGIRLMTNNPDKIRAVEGPNREVVVRERVPMVPLAWKTGGKLGVRGDEVGSYLRTKIQKMGHLL
ncbi:MAG: GTP cyclohydrolase II [Watsoniomyces obsoletus]|nr:MAG: GTP cyclohydrolase II [Watsoniomyces obsoletus]